MKPVFLVACAKTKGRATCAAKDLYQSALFQKTRAYVEAAGGDWFILSAEHGLLHPDKVIAPYDTTLHSMDNQARKAWANRVHAGMMAYRVIPGLRPRVVFFAGALYREHLEPWLTLNGRSPSRVEVPLRGLGIGQQLAWLTANKPEPPPPSAPAINWEEVEDSRPNIWNDEGEITPRYLYPRRFGGRYGGDAKPGPEIWGADLPLFQAADRREAA